MTHKERLSIILTWMDLDLSGRIPDKPSFIPGVGSSPNANSHAADIFRMIVKYWSAPDKSDLVDELCEQLRGINKISGQ